MESDIKDLFKDSFVNEVPPEIWEGVKAKTEKRPVFEVPLFRLVLAGVFTVLIMFSVVFGALQSRQSVYDPSLFEVALLDDSLFEADFGSDIETYFL